MSNDDLFTTAAAAEYVGVSTQALGARRLAKDYERKAVRGKLYYERGWLDEWKKQRQEQAEKVLSK